MVVAKGCQKVIKLFNTLIWQNMIWQLVLGRQMFFDLRWKQIAFKRRTCEYYSENMKSGKPLVIPLNDTAINVLARPLGKHEKYVFLHSRNQPVKSLNYKLWKEALDKAGIEKDFYWHDLRHTWASWLVQNGVSLMP